MKKLLLILLCVPFMGIGQESTPYFLAKEDPNTKIKGRFFTNTGECIEGDCKDGNGTYIFVGEEKYIGEFDEEGYPSEGILFFPNGDKYEGKFSFDF